MRGKHAIRMLSTSGGHYLRTFFVFGIYFVKYVAKIRKINARPQDTIPLQMASNCNPIITVIRASKAKMIVK